MIEAVVVSYETRALLEDCLKSLAAICPSVAVTVVDSASCDGSAAMVASRFPEARLIALAENRGFAAAVNAGVAATEAPFLFVLNADTAVETDPLPSLRQAMEAHPRWAVAGPALAHPDGRPQESRTPFPRVQDALAAFLRGGTGAAGGGGAVGGGGAAALAPDALAPAAGDAAPGWYLMGAALLFRRRALDAVGPLDESYFFYLEEVDWFRRAAAAGWGWGLVSEARVTHHLGASLRAADPALAMRIKRNWYRSRLRYFRRHAGRPAAVLLRAGSIPFLAANALRHEAVSWFGGGVVRRARARSAWGLLGDYVLGRVEPW